MGNIGGMGIGNWEWEYVGNMVGICGEYGGNMWGICGEYGVIPKYWGNMWGIWCYS